MAGLLIFAIGIVVVVLWRRLNNAQFDIEKLTRRIDDLERQPVTPRSTQGVSETPVPRPKREPELARVDEPVPVERQTPQRPVITQPPLSESSSAEAGSGLADWLFGGNPVVRVGVVVLLCGVAFFFNYAIDRGWLPVEVRLTLAAIGGLALTTVGWRLRESRRDYALVLQGGGIGIVYLTVFAAVNLYALIGVGSGLTLMVVLVALSSALAVMQDAHSLAVLATLAGFLAPVLVSRGGSHVALFSYYAALDVGILAIAWFKQWRLLNRLGFVCTFIVSAAWGAQYYTPQHFASTEPFLLAYFLFYIAVPVLFARRTRAATIHAVDGPLVFGVPIIAFALQAPLVRNFEYGLAFSALGAGMLYVALGFALWRRPAEFSRALVEAFLALGVGFGTLAIPLAFDGRWTGSAWALEGAGLVWLGVRQRRWLGRTAGLFLQLTAGFSLLSAEGLAADVPVLNSFCLGAVLVSVSAFFSALYLYRQRAVLESPEVDLPIPLLAWSLLWWCGAGVREISTHLTYLHRQDAYLMFAAGTAALLALLRQHLAWRYLSVPVLLLLPVMTFLAFAAFVMSAHPMVRFGSVAWITAMAAHYWIQRRLESDWPTHIAALLHQGMLLLVVFLASWELAWLAGHISRGTGTWRHVAWMIVPCAAIVGLPSLHRRLTWPLQQFAEAYRTALIPIVALAGVWLLLTSVTRGNPAPLAYFPLLNPLEIAQCLVLTIIAQWMWANQTDISAQARRSVLSILIFVVLNGMIARVTHFQMGVEFDWTALWASPIYQAAVSIVWTIAALVVMLSAARLQQRTAWFAGAGLLAMVVAKLFFVDLDDVGTVARIVSFVCVGLLMLLMGYLSPLPPRLEESPS